MSEILYETAIEKFSPPYGQVFQMHPSERVFFQTQRGLFDLTNINHLIRTVHNHYWGPDPIPTEVSDPFKNHLVVLNQPGTIRGVFIYNQENLVGHPRYFGCPFNVHPFGFPPCPFNLAYALPVVSLDDIDTGETAIDYAY